MKVLITGVNGMLGSAILNIFYRDKKFELYGVGRSNKKHNSLNQYFIGDLTNPDFIKKISTKVNFDWIIHCAAIVDLKYCEENPDKAHTLHVNSTNLLSKYNPNSKFIYISTDSIFDGTQGNYLEIDEPNPLNIYANTKFQGEMVIQKNHTNYYIIRLNIFGQNNSGGNSLFEWAYKSLFEGNGIYGFDNVIFNPLHVKKVSRILLKFIEVEPPIGVYNLGSLYPISKFDFIKKIAKKNNLDTNLISSKTVDFSSSSISRPLNTSLNIEKLKLLRLEIDLTLNKHLKVNK